MFTSLHPSVFPLDPGGLRGGSAGERGDDDEKGDCMKKMLLLPGLLLFAGAAGCSGSRPTGLGVHGGRLAVCPNSPNCVSSQADPADKRHLISPIPYEGGREDAYNRLLRVLSGMKGARITESSGDYIRAEFTSAVFRFVDDVEFYFPKRPQIEVRSASRLGYWDFGVNRKRIEKVRRLFGSEEK